MADDIITNLEIIKKLLFPETDFFNIERDKTYLFNKNFGVYISHAITTQVRIDRLPTVGPTLLKSWSNIIGQRLGQLVK